jgi:hypothetical protein
MEKPEFSAEDINKISALARKTGKQGAYYQEVKRFVLDKLDVPAKHLSEGQLKWLWGIKADLKED